MCKSFETSLATFVFSFVCLGSSLQIYKTKDVVFAALLIFTVSLIQLIDSGIWWSLNNKNNELNNILSRYAIPIVLSLELLVSYFGTKYIFGWNSRYFEYALTIFVSYILIVWIFKYCSGDKNRDSHTIPYTDGYLYWCGVNLYPIVRVLFILFLLLPIIIGIPSKYIIVKYIITLPIIVSFIMNYLNITFGARWCWSSNITSVLLLLYSIYMKYK